MQSPDVENTNSQTKFEMTCLKCGQADLIMSYDNNHEHIVCPMCGYQFLWDIKTMGEEFLGKETQPQGAVVIKSFNEVIHCSPIKNKKRFNVKKFTEGILCDKDDYIEVYYTEFNSETLKWEKRHIIEPVLEAERFAYFNLYLKPSGNLVSQRIPKEMSESDIDKEINYILKNKSKLTGAEYIYYNKEKKTWYRRPILGKDTVDEKTSWFKNIFKKKERKEKRRLFYKK